MTDDEYLVWSRRHAALFGMSRDEDFTTLAGWRRLFEVAVYTVAELNDASDFLAMSGLPCRWPAEQLPILTRRIKDRRSVEYRRDQEVQHDGELGTCTVCGSTGWATVPHPAGIRQGKWVAIRLTRGLTSYYTAAVTCRCAKGQWVAGRISADKKPLSLDEYEQVNPDWWSHLRQRAAEVRAAHEHEGYTESALTLRSLLKQRLRGLSEANGIPAPACLGDEREPGAEG